MFFRRLSILPVAVLALFTGACASTTAAIPHPFPLPGPVQTGTNAGAAPAPAPKAPAPKSPAPKAPAPPRGGKLPTPLGTPSAPLVNASGSADGYAITSTALALRGTPYVNGGADPTTGFDCSGFTQYVFNQHGLSLPREVREQVSTGKKVKPEELKVGDLIFFSTTAPGATHVGIAIGGDQFIHAPSSTGVVRIERLSSTYWSQRFVGARRVM